MGQFKVWTAPADQIGDGPAGLGSPTGDRLMPERCTKENPAQKGGVVFVHQTGGSALSPDGL